MFCMNIFVMNLAHFVLARGRMDTFRELAKNRQFFAKTRWKCEGFAQEKSIYVIGDNQSILPTWRNNSECTIFNACYTPHISLLTKKLLLLLRVEET